MLGWAVLERLTLDPSRVDLWLLPSDDARLDDRLEHLETLLLPDERVRVERIVVPRARREQVLTRIFLRQVLSRYAPVAPQAWRFDENAHGRPHIAGPALERRIDFNLSHTAGLIVCLVGLERVLGVDVEDAERGRRNVEIAERFFSPSEAAELRSLPEQAQGRRFLHYWTLKEAYIKARGMGLALPLSQFSFHLDALPAVRISFDPRLDDDPAAWWFELSEPTPRHQLALALRLEGAPLPELRRLDGLPLVLGA